MYVFIIKADGEKAKQDARQTAKDAHQHVKDVVDHATVTNNKKCLILKILPYERK